MDAKPPCPNCNEPMHRDGKPQKHHLGGYYQGWRCLNCRIAITILPPPAEMANPFHPASLGAQSGSYEEWEDLHYDFLPEIEDF